MNTRSLAFLALFLLASAARSADSVVWQIGRPDHSHAEFALSANYPGFMARFGQAPLVFEVGRSDAAADWPFIHPGPVDVWAGSREHPFTIRFSLPDPPRGVYTLRVELADTHKGVPPLYRIALGERSGVFRLPAGAGDGSLGNPTAGAPHAVEVRLPASVLRAGANDLVLTCQEGSWVQYDAITLLADPEAQLPEPRVTRLAAVPTPFFVTRAERLRRVVRVEADVNVPAVELAVRAEAGGETVEALARSGLGFGTVSVDLDLPDSEQPQPVRVTATLAGQTTTAEAVAEPRRKWHVFVAPSAHTDVGYTDLQAACAERHAANADAAVEVLKSDPGFRWNLEVAWQAEHLLATRSGPALDGFVAATRAGQIGVQALYANLLTGLCSHEESCRFFALARRLSRTYGWPYESAMISDVPTQEATLPMIAAASGIRYLSSGINNSRAMTFNRMYAKSPCWWEGPDGSRVLMMYMPGYAHASGWGLDASLERATERVLANLQAFEARADYPYDAVFLHGAVSDNCALSPRLAEVVRAWNERYTFPKLILCRNAEFFRHIEERYADRLPVVRGSAGTYWEDGAGSSARETALCRNAHETLTTAETLFALQARLEPGAAYPRAALEEAWRNCLLYDEHTWGAHCSVSQPESEFTRAQWQVKAQFAVDADRQARQLLDAASRGVAGLVRTEGPAAVVLNPLSWSRTDVVELTLPEGLTLRDAAAAAGTGRPGTALVLARDVPACGWQALPLVPGVPPPPEPLPAGDTLESRFYRVRFDPATGTVVSVVDKESGRELVDTAAPWRLNQYLYVAGGRDTRLTETGPEPQLTISSPTAATLRRVRLGSLGERMVVDSSTTCTPSLQTEVTVWNDVRRIDITNRLRKDLTYEKEAVYFAFPFAAANPTVRYGIPLGFVTANTDMLPGACLDWFTVQHVVETSTPEATVAWASPDTPLVCLQDINRGKWQTELPLRTGHLFAYAMNNYWYTNYLAGQGGEFTFRFALTSRADGGDRVASEHFGWGVASPLRAVTRAAANPGGILTGPAGALLDIGAPNVLLVGARQAETGDALVLRLWEAAGRAAQADIALRQGGPLREAQPCNLVDDPQGDPLAVRDGRMVRVPLKAASVATLRLR